MKFLVLDIEAIVDASIWTPPDPPDAWQLDGWVGRRGYDGYPLDGVTAQPPTPDAFAPPQAWRPVCIGMVLLEPGPGGIVTRKIGALEEPDERDLLVRFGETVSRLAPVTLVTWNGRAYDVPALVFRSLRYGLTQGWYPATRHRYNEERHLDLMDSMGNYGACRSLKLDEMARLIGLPGKPRGADEVSGKNVGPAYAAGRLPEIVAYCVADAVQTAFVWMRWSLLRGAIGLDEYRNGAAMLLDACDHDARLGGLVASVDRRVLLLEQGEEAAA